MLARELQGVVLAPQPFERRDRLVAQEAVLLGQGCGQHVHRFLAGDLGECRRDVAADPDVFVGIAHEVRQRVHDGFAVADEHHSRAALEPAVAEQGDQRRHEHEIVGAGDPHAGHRLVGHVRRGIVEQRDEEPAEPGK